MRHKKITWEDGSKEFLTLITRGSAFQFGMADIARIREEVGTLIDRLSIQYLKMKEQEKAAKRAKRKEAKTLKTHEKEEKENIPESQDTAVPPAPAAKRHKAERVSPDAPVDQGGCDGKRLTAGKHITMMFCAALSPSAEPRVGDRCGKRGKKKRERKAGGATSLRTSS